MSIDSVVEDLTLRSAWVGVAEFVKDFILVTIVPIRELTFCGRIPLIFFVLFVGAEWNLELYVLVSDVSHNSEFRVFGSVVHNSVKIVEVLLTVFCLLSAIRRLFLEFRLLNGSLCGGLDVGHVRKEGRRQV